MSTHEHYITLMIYITTLIGLIFRIIPCRLSKINIPSTDLSIRGGAGTFTHLKWSLVPLKSIVYDIHENCYNFNEKYHL